MLSDLLLSILAVAVMLLIREVALLRQEQREAQRMLARHGRDLNDLQRDTDALQINVLGLDWDLQAAESVLHR